MFAKLSADFVGGWAMAQLWMFWVMPIAGAAAAGFLYKFVLEDSREPLVTARQVQNP